MEAAGEPAALAVVSQLASLGGHGGRLRLEGSAGSVGAMMIGAAEIVAAAVSAAASMAVALGRAIAVLLAGPVVA